VTPRKRSLHGVLFALAAVGCASSVQRAVVSAPAPVIAARESNDDRTLGVDTDHGGARKEEEWVVAPERTRFLIRARNALVDQTFTFRSFRATAVETSDRAFSFHAEIDAASLEGGAAGLASFVKGHLLEVDSYPDATFDGTVHRTGDTDACDVSGTLRLHGVERALRFLATMHEEATDLRLLAVFDLARKPFNVGLHGVLDGLIPDDIRVTLDVRAHRESGPGGATP
jgi:polyisoprenoid-binding protein YceI